MQVKNKKYKVSKFNFYFIILNEIKQNNRLPDSIYKQKRNWYVSWLKRKGFVKKVGYGSWQITDAGLKFLEEVKESKERVKQPISLDFVMRIKLPILKELENPFEPDIERKARGWIRKYKWYNVPFYNYNLTFEKTPKSMIVHVHHMEISNPGDIDVITRHVLRFVKEYFATKRIMLLDDLNASVIFIKGGIYDKNLKELIPPGQYPEFYLGRKRAKILEHDPDQEAKVWMDSTPFDWTVHSNDKTYVERYIKMPEVVDSLDKKLIPAIEKLTEQINLHLDVQRATQETMKVIRDNIKLLPKEDGWKIWKKIIKEK
jgi:predicted transcriptional regulator